MRKQRKEREAVQHRKTVASLSMVIVFTISSNLPPQIKVGMTLAMLGALSIAVSDKGPAHPRTDYPGLVLLFSGAAVGLMSCFNGDDQAGLAPR